MALNDTLQSGADSRWLANSVHAIRKLVTAKAQTLQQLRIVLPSRSTEYRDGCEATFWFNLLVAVKRVSNVF